MTDSSHTHTLTRYTVHFEGRVQGVGFRFTTAHIAGNHDVAGYVQNLPDGRVLVVAEGAQGTLQAFIDEVERQMKRYIRHVSIDTSDATGEFGEPGAPETFGVRH